MINNKKVINSFWNKIYKEVDDGGYISDDSIINNFRYLYEKEELISFIDRYMVNGEKNRALDVGCGNGRFTKVLSNYFNNVDAIDLSEDIILKNIKNNHLKNCNYYNKSLEEFANKTEFKYDFIYVGGVLMYIEDSELPKSLELLCKILKPNGVLIFRESVMTKKRVDNIGKNYIAYYRYYKDYIYTCDLNLVLIKQNLAYRISELDILLRKLKIGFLFRDILYKKILPILRVKDIFWKPKHNKLVNYYYIFRGKKS
jgi:2-polyprenyl-3-methyl-5-hydroxy-6-metoxy-1,4-benzoquinol methylase